MDKSSNMDTSATDTNVSNIPTATPIASEIISDFEPDPKFEITPLERATFDCNDLFLQDNSTEFSLQSENGKQDEVNVSQESGFAPNSQDSDLQQTSSEGKETGLHPSDSAKNYNHQPETEGQRSIGKPRLNISSSDVTPAKINDCPPVSEKYEPSDTDHLTATISVEESIAASALVQVAEGQTIKADDIQSTKDPNSDRQQQYSAMETSQPIERVQTDQEREHANYFYSISQTSVDAQMEKVIENIVELGEGHEFSHTLSQVEDREKLLESIHREITSVQSSIDLIADVASKQQSIEISPTKSDKEEDKQKTQDKHIDLKANATLPITVVDVPQVKAHRVETLDETAKVSPVPGEIEAADKTQVEDLFTETVDALKAGESKSAEPIIQIEPIVEEPLVTNEDDIEQLKKEYKEAEQPSVDLVVEPLESDDDVGEPLSSAPVVDEALSADEMDQPSKKLVVQTDAKLVDTVTVTETKNKINEESHLAEATDTTVVLEREKSPTTAHVSRRKSGRKPKPVKELAEDASLEESRRNSRRTSSRKRPVEIEHPIETEAEVAMEVQPKEPEHIIDTLDNAEQAMPHMDKNEEVKQVEEEDAIKEVKKVEQIEKHVDDTLELVDEPARRPSRSIRVRAPKRPLEEDSLKAEPPKKQVKRSRGASDDLNKSSEPIRSTPTIKLPTLKSRKTISTSDPSSRPGARKESGEKVDPDQWKYFCKCGFFTNRVNNMVYHETKIPCEDKDELADQMKKQVIKQQQSSKGKRLQLP